MAAVTFSYCNALELQWHVLLFVIWATAGLACFFYAHRAHLRNIHRTRLSWSDSYRFVGLFPRFLYTDAHLHTDTHTHMPAIKRYPELNSGHTAFLFVTVVYSYWLQSVASARNQWHGRRSLVLQPCHFPDPLTGVRIRVFGHFFDWLRRLTWLNEVDLRCWYSPYSTGSLSILCTACFLAIFEFPFFLILLALQYRINYRIRWLLFDCGTIVSIGRALFLSDKNSQFVCFQIKIIVSTMWKTRKVKWSASKRNVRSDFLIWTS